MRRVLALMLAAVIAGCLPCGTALAETKEPTAAAVEKQFRELPMEARRLTGPLFWMHGTESQAQLEGELRKVVEGGNGVFTTEPRPHKDWLGEGWYRDLDICLQFAKKNDLTLIIYDDHWWPSQMMGGRVPEQYGSKLLEATTVSITGPKKISEAGYGDANIIAVIAGKAADGDTVDGSSLVNLTASVKNGMLEWDAPAGEWRVMKFAWKFKGKRGGQQQMISVDGADRECVDWFIKTVYQPHYDRFKQDFGKAIVGYFYDEPETQGDWGSDMITLAVERKLDLNKLLVAYKFKLAGEEQTAAFYGYLDLFAEAWGRTMYGGMAKWCREHNVFSMGHFMEHGNDFFSRGMSGGNMMQLQKYSDMGGIDLVCNQVFPGQRNMGLYQMPKIASSISHTYNKANDVAFCEIYGGYNQVLTYPQMKWLADWHHVRGVNMLIPHSFNPRAPYDSDYPPYFYNGGFEPRWPLYRVWADYSSRLSTLLTGGRHVCPVAFLHVGQSMHAGKAVRPEEFTSTLQDALFDCDWVLYDAWENDAKLDGKALKLHKETYQILVVPPVEVIPCATLAKAKEFFEKGGIVVGYNFLPSKSATLGKTSADIAALRDAIWGDAQPGLTACKTSAAGGKAYFLPAKPSVDDVQKALTGSAGIHPTLEVVAGKTDNWLHVLHRVKAGSDVFLVCNQNHTGDARHFRFRITASGEPEVWDAMRNEITSVQYERVADNVVELELTLEPSESVVLMFQKDKRELPGRMPLAVKPARAPIEVVRDATPPEMIIPSAPQAAAPTPTTTDVSFNGCAWVWYPDGNPAQAAPPGTRYFRGGCTVPAGRKAKLARFVGTCDNAFTLFVNGKEAGKSSDDPEGWRAPTKIDITKLIIEGTNVFAFSALNMTDQPSPAGLIGKYEIAFEDGAPMTGSIDATWKAADKEQPGWNQTAYDDRAWPAAKVLGNYGCAPWGSFASAGGTKPGKVAVSPVKSDPFCGHCELPADVNLAKVRAVIEMDEITPEAAARVTVNGQYAGGFLGKPFRLDVTKHLKPGANKIVIEPFAPKSAKLLMYEHGM
ncbi:MAG TPA: glycosyl hydrolase [Planctomycetota bacterium]|jgi:hypothetical protein